MPSIRRAAPRRQIAQRIRAARLAIPISQEAVAKKLRLHRQQWRRIEAGQQSIPAERLIDVCEIIQTNVDHLLGIA